MFLTTTTQRTAAEDDQLREDPGRCAWLIFKGLMFAF